MQIGHKAPEFTLRDTDKKEVSLSDFKGKNVVLLFFPAAFTGTCTKELCQMRDELTYYNNLNAQVLGISVDSLFVLNKYKQDQNLNFPLLSDFNKNVSASYKALYLDWLYDMKGVSKRASFVIDKNGVIQFSEILENAGDYPNMDAIKQTLETLTK